MDGKNTLKPPKDLNDQYFKVIRRNLKLLMDCTDINQNQLCLLLQQRGMKANQGNISRFLAGEIGIQLSMLVAICEIYHVTFEQLLDEHYQYTPWNTDDRHTELPKLYSDDLLLHIPYLGDSFITAPSDSHFTGYLQTYYVYFFPSQGDEEKVRTGTLKLMENGSVCEAVLEINTNKIRDGKPYTKVYRGRCIISTTMRTVFILLTAHDTGELSIVNFRYHNLSTYPLDCRIACVLLNATGVEHPPVIQRMFLSRTEIAPEHISLLQPHLYLNNGIIQIRKNDLELLQESDSAYHGVVDELFRTNHPQCVYYLDEDDVLSAARRCLDEKGIPLRNPEDPQVNRFLARLRALSNHSRFNKASRQADHLSRRLLRSLGYFHDHEYDN